MKKVSITLLAILTVLLVGCSGSETYRGSWKATDSKGAKFELFFNAKNFTVKDSLGKSEKYDYSQNSVEIKNSVATYGIQLGDGRGYQINFPNANNETLGLIKDENGNPLYTISRKDYIKYEDVFKL
jgi:major membrane immunogen (membrane-anchored lipoprotein)